jgi:hypothetical protein
MTSPAVCVIRISVSPELTAALARAAALLEKLAQSGIEPFEFPQGALKAGVFFDTDWLPASGANEAVLLLQPSQRLLDFVAAGGAGEFDAELVCQRFHGALLGG